MSFFGELKRRNVFRVAAAYIIIGWLLLQVSDTLVPALRLPEWFHSGVAFVLILGFPLALIFAWAYELTPEGLKKEKTVERSQSVTRQTGRKLDFVIIGLLAVAVVYLVWDKFGGDERDRVPETTAEAKRLASDAVGKDEEHRASIAVLPFTNMSEDASNEYFSDGVSEEILNALAQVEALKVAGRTSSFAFKGRNEDLRLIGDTLGVSHILEGSVRKSGNTVRVTAQLIAVEDGFHVWSNTWDRELNDIFAIQDEVAAAILTELKAKLVGEDRPVSARADPRAYDRYLQARELIYTRSRPQLQRARELLDEALDLDPQFAPAWAQRGILSLLLSDRQYGTVPEAEARARAKRYLDRALELDDELAEGWAGLGLYFSTAPGTEKDALAREHLERALELNPSMINASNWLYALLNREHRVGESLALLEDIFERDPLYRPTLYNLMLTYATLGRQGDMAAMLDRVRPVLGKEPNVLAAEANLRASRGDLAGSLPLAEAAFQAAPTNQSAVSALGRTLFYLNEFDRMLSLPWVTGELFEATALSYLGRNEEAAIGARERFNETGRAYPLLTVLVNTGEYDAAVTFVEERWPELSAFDESQKQSFGFGHPTLLMYAKACLETGRLDAFRQAMRLVREDHDKQMEQGAAWQYIYLPEASYWTLAGDYDRAVDYLARAVDAGWVAAPRISDLYPILKPLEGGERFEKVQARALENLNRERGEAGLQPLEPADSF